MTCLVGCCTLQSRKTDWRFVTHRPDNERNTRFWNFGLFLRDNTALHPSIQSCSQSLPWQPEISEVYIVFWIVNHHRKFVCTWQLFSIREKLLLKAKAVPLHAMKTLGGEEYSSYSFSTSELDGGEWSALRPGRALAPEKGLPVPVVQEAG
jgi:hypothetical protein